MGDPKFSRRTYETPKHPWEQARMDEERKLLQKYGLKNKRELWKAQSTLRTIRRQARTLQARLRAKEPQAEKETRWLLERLLREGLLTTTTPTLDDVLALSVESVIERRLQWLVYVKGLAPTPVASRQLIVHGHIAVGSHRVTRPGYRVRRDEEPQISYAPFSPLFDESHPLRVALRERSEGTSPIAIVSEAGGGSEGGSP